MNLTPHTQFLPSPWLRNPHVQSILSSTLPRKILVKSKAKQLIQAAKEEVIQCSDGVRLLGEYSPNTAANKLVIMLHGWEGCIESNYMLSVGAHLYQQGYSVFRLNLRDHGSSKHLNERPYNSTRLVEILDAMDEIQRLYPHNENYLLGFSLGGNFSLRIGANAQGRQFNFKKIIAVCPVISPAHTMASLENGLSLYHKHFVEHWKSSLLDKLQYYPQLGYQDALPPLKSLLAMNEYFIPHLTDYDTLPAYYEAYSVSGSYLQNLTTPTHIITSADDPVVLCEDLKLLTQIPASLTIEVTKYGGHCAFIQNLKLDSWIDLRISQLLLA